jgi:hypothetical protein
MPEPNILSHRRDAGIMGTNTRQRAALDWTPLSLHPSGQRAKGLTPFSAPPPSPKLTGGPPFAGARLHLSLEWDGMRVRMCF